MRAESLNISTRKVTHCYVTASKHVSMATKTCYYANRHTHNNRTAGSSVFYRVSAEAK
jgi:hypothetical protein